MIFELFFLQYYTKIITDYRATECTFYDDAQEIVDKFDGISFFFYSRLEIQYSKLSLCSELRSGGSGADRI